MYDAMFHTVMFLPIMEKPVNSIEDVVERELIPIIGPGATYLLDWMNGFENQEKKALGQRTIMPDSWGKLEELVFDNILEGDKHVWMTEYLIPGHDYMHYRDFHISKEPLGGLNPWSVMLMNKKFHLEEKLKIHIMKFQQVSYKMGVTAHNY